MRGDIEDAVGAQREQIGPDLSSLVRLDSQNPPGREEAVARFVGERLEKLGAQVEYQWVQPGRPNVIGVLDFGPGPRLMLNAHTDTVPVTSGDRDLLEPVIKDGNLYGRGTCDDKGGLLAMLIACTAAVRMKRDGRGLVGTLVFAGVMGEEASGEGTRHLVKHGPLADFAVVGEPTELKPVLGHKGSWRKRLTIHGRAAHSSDPRLGANAIYGVAMVALEVEQLNAALQNTITPLFGSPAVSANVVHGGKQVIIIADTCELEIDRRLLPGETDDDAQVEMNGILRRMLDRYPQLTAEWTDLGMGKKPSIIESDSALAMSLKESIRSVTGNAPADAGFSGGTDMTFLMEAGVPTIIFGPGSLTHAHTVNEHVPLHEVEQAARVYLELFDRLGR